MAKFGTHIDLGGLGELQNAKIQNLGSAPTGLGTGDRGRIYVDSTTGRLYIWNGSGFALVATDSDLLGGENSAYHLALNNATGFLTSGQVSDFDAQVRSSRLDQMAAATSPIVIPDGTLATHAASKGQLDSAIASLASGQVPKGAVRAAADGNVNIASAPATVDGITPTAGDVVLLTGQTDGTQNGPYVWPGAGSPMTRATNWDTNTEAALGSYWVVLQGTHADSYALLTNDTAITLGTSTPAFVFISGGASYLAGAGLTLTGDTFAVGAGAGIAVAADSVAIDPAVGVRKVTGVIPTASSGIFTVSGSTVGIIHGLNNPAPGVVVRFYTSPGAGNTQGQEYRLDPIAVDANNVNIVFPDPPAANQFAVTVWG